MQRISAGKIIAQLVLEDDQYSKALRAALTAAQTVGAKIGSALSGLGEAFTGIGNKISESAEKITFLGAAITGPLLLSMKAYADQNETISEKVGKLQEELRGLAPWESQRGANLYKQIILLREQQKDTARAAAWTNALTEQAKRFNNELGSLLWDTLSPYLPKLQEVIKASIDWIKENRELAARIAKVVMAVGLAFAIIGPTLMILGKLISTIGVFTSAIGGLITLLSSGFVLSIIAITAAFGGLYYVFKDQINPIIKEHIPILQNLWDEWQSGSISTEEAISRLSDALKSFAVDTLSAVGGKINEYFDAKSGGKLNKTLEDFFTWALITFDKFKTGFGAAWDWVAEKLQWASATISSLFAQYNKTQEEFFYQYIRMNQKMQDVVTAVWDATVGKIEWAYNKVKGVFDKIKSLLDDAVGHSWFVDSMHRFYTYTNDYFAGSAMVMTESSKRMMHALNAAKFAAAKLRVINGQKFSAGSAFAPILGNAGKLAMAGGAGIAAAYSPASQSISNSLTMNGGVLLSDIGREMETAAARAFDRRFKRVLREMR